MKYELPEKHGLSDSAVKQPGFLPTEKSGEPSITDIQHEALGAGVARGVSMLCVAPTSTGKTLIGIWSAISWLEKNLAHQVVYLVTHRALARQKFEELQQLFKDSVLGGDMSAVVLANGDTVEDGQGAVPANPFGATLLVATYEKYLAMLAGNGIPHDLSRTAFICDEIQIIGDETRGRSIETLLTLLLKTKWGQLVGLSAVLESRDAQSLADWLRLKLVMVSKREKQLLYQCRTPAAEYHFHTGENGRGIIRTEKESNLRAESIFEELKSKASNLPVVIFCMTKNRVYQLSSLIAGLSDEEIGKRPVELIEGLTEATEAAIKLSAYIKKRVAFHAADLLEDERLVVEQALKNKEIDVVVATSTLAAGVNFPLGAVIFDDWKRWDQRSRNHIPIPSSEFHNMSGRAGRMGYDNEFGTVVFSVANTGIQERQALTYLSPDNISELSPRMEPKYFEQIALQMLSSGLCSTEEDVYDFLLGTYTAFRELNRNKAALEHWREAVGSSINSLRSAGFLI